MHNPMDSNHRKDTIMTGYYILELEARIWARDEFADSDASITASTLALRIHDEFPKLFMADCASIAIKAIDDYLQNEEELS